MLFNWASFKAESLYHGFAITGAVLKSYILKLFSFLVSNKLQKTPSLSVGSIQIYFDIGITYEVVLWVLAWISIVGFLGGNLLF